MGFLNGLGTFELERLVNKTDFFSSIFSLKDLKDMKRKEVELLKNYSSKY